MKRAVLFVGLLGMMFLPFLARAAEVDTLNLQDKQVDALFTSRDSSGCIQTDVFVLASTTRRKDSGSPPMTEPLIYVQYAVNDICNAVLLHSGFGTNNMLNLSLNGALTRAHADSVVLVGVDETGGSFYMQVSVDWTGVGDTTTGRFDQHLITPAFSVELFSAKSTFRQATASATVPDGITNFTPPGSTVVFADLQITKSETVTVQRN